MVMDNFESKSLKKTFKTIVFGTLVGGPNMMSGAPAKAVDLGPIQVAKASGANARTVAEVVAQAAALKGKPVKVSGKVVKFNGDILGKNWLHLQDGSGNGRQNRHPGHPVPRQPRWATWSPSPVWCAKTRTVALATATSAD